MATKAKKKRKYTRRAKPRIEHHDVAVETQDVAVDERVDPKFWPKGVPFPDSVVKLRPRFIPCPHCRRVRLDNGGQAVAVTSSGPDIVWFRCRACDTRFKLAVKAEE